MKKIICLILCLIFCSGCAVGSAPRESASAATRTPTNTPALAERQSPAQTPSPLPTETPTETPTTVPIVAPIVTPKPSQEAQASPTAASVDLWSLSNNKQGWGPGMDTDEKGRPISAESFQEKYGKYGALFIMPESPKVYLTFDEGYENGYTARILDTLKEKNVHAVFFVTMPYVKGNPELVRRMIDEGHIVGNHSVTHPSMPDLSIEGAKKEITQLHDYVRSEFSCEMTLFRPPMGEFSERTLALTDSLGYKSVLWSFAYRDWEVDNQPGQEDAFQRITNSAHPGALYLLHAVSSTNTAILGRVIDALRDKGYEFALI